MHPGDAGPDETPAPEKRLPVPCLMLVTDRHLAGGEDALLEKVDAAVEGGADVVQLREKDLSRADLLSLALRLREVTEGRALLFVNGDQKVALEAGADGVHFPADAYGPEPPWTFIWGRSVHSEEAAMFAMAEAARYVIAGPIYATPSHPDTPPAGLRLIREIVPVARIPVIGIGGINARNARDVIQAGASGVAVISAILAADSALDAARALRSTIDSAYPVRPRPGYLPR